MAKKFVVLFLLVVVGVLASIPFRILLFSRSSSAANCDAALVLGASTRRGQPSPIFKARIDHGIELFKSGRVQWLIFTGGPEPGAYFSDAWVAAQYAICRGVPSEKILLETKSQNTYQNLFYAREISAAKGIHSFLVVTDPFHMLRAMTMADDQGIQAQPSVAADSSNNQLRFFLSESMKNLVYRIIRLSGDRGRISFLEAENY
jgi:uncharacterized SAM-binding protein YcdF (DUF218 family)